MNNTEQQSFSARIYRVSYVNPKESLEVKEVCFLSEDDSIFKILSLFTEWKHQCGLEEAKEVAVNPAGTLGSLRIAF